MENNDMTQDNTPEEQAGQPINETSEAATPEAPSAEQAQKDQELRDKLLARRSARPNNKKERKFGGPGPKKQEIEDSGLIEKVIAINRVAKATKGGTKLSFSALVVVGDAKGRVGYALGKAGEVATAIKKGINGAKRRMVLIPMSGSTITHEIIGQCGGARVLLKPASEGTGVIAAGPVRAVCDGVGIHNILTKCHRSNNPINVVKATIDGLSRLKAARTDARDQS
jgi:small subunit ribosomal protein S5